MSMNAMHCWAIITDDFEKAESIINQIKYEHQSRMMEQITIPSYFTYKSTIYFEDGLRVVWLRGSSDIRGYRFHRAWVDNKIHIKDEWLPVFVCGFDNITWI